MSAYKNLTKSDFIKAWKTDRKYLTSGHLKIIACLAMFLSHLAQSGLIYNLGYTKIADFFMLIGRISMPLFCFMAVQGIELSTNKSKYLSRLFIFALISEIPFDLSFSAMVIDLFRQNVFFTLFFGSLMIFIWEKILDFNFNALIKYLLCLMVMFVFCLISALLNTDYFYFGIIAIGILYIARNSRKMTIIGLLLAFAFEANTSGYELAIPCMVYLSVPLVYLYNGKRGTYNKWIFYSFYPLHLLLIYALKFIVFYYLY